MNRLLVRCLTPLLFLLGAAGLPCAFAQDLAVGAQVDKTEVASGEFLTFSITLSGPLIQDPPKVQLTSFEGFRVVSTGQSQQIQAGGGSVRTTLTLSYTLAPTTLGTHTLGPVKVEYQGKVIQTQPIEVTVVAPSEKSSQKGQEREEQSVPPRLEGGVIL